VRPLAPRWETHEQSNIGEPAGGSLYIEVEMFGLCFGGAFRWRNQKRAREGRSICGVPAFGYHRTWSNPLEIRFVAAFIGGLIVAVRSG
jgi:hypothetical protein